jgi:hypothetical protein
MATFAIDVSSTFMNVASATAIVASTSCPPCSGGGGAGGADAGAEGAADGGWLKRFSRIDVPRTSRADSPALLHGHAPLSAAKVRLRCR